MSPYPEIAATSDDDKDGLTLPAEYVRGTALMTVTGWHYEGERPLADLWLTLARKARLKNERFADSKGMLRELA